MSCPVDARGGSRILLTQLWSLPSDAHRLGFHVVEFLDGALAAGVHPALIPFEPLQLTKEVIPSRVEGCWVSFIQSVDEFSDAVECFDDALERHYLLHPLLAVLLLRQVPQRLAHRLEIRLGFCRCDPFGLAGAYISPT